jgi:NTE family protein
MTRLSEIRVGVALSGGGAAAMAHVGVLEELQGAGITIGWLAGSSTGSMVGAACAAGRLTGFRDTMCALTHRQVLRLFDPTWPRAGLLHGRRALETVREYLGERIETLPCSYAAVATDLNSGHEVILHEGDVFEAVRASIAVPGLLVPQRWQGRVLVDGGLSNPVPVSVVRGLGARFVIAVSVLGMPADTSVSSPPHEHGMAGQLLSRFMARLYEGDTPGEPQNEVPTRPPGESVEEAGLIAILSRAVAVAHSRLAAARLQMEPPDFMIAVPVPKVGLFDFHRSAELVAAGRAAGQQALPALRKAIESALPFSERLSRWLGGATQRLTRLHGA